MIYALTTDQGTAAAETALCGVHLASHESHARQAADKDTGETFHDCTGNDQLACIVCGES